MAIFDELTGALHTSAELGTPYVEDSLAREAARPVSLRVTTSLAADAGACGRGDDGWFVAAGLPDSQTIAVLDDAVVPGNRSLLARLSFRSTQTGVAPGEHGMVELRLSRGTTEANVPARILVDNGAFCVLDLNTGHTIAGSRTERVFEMVVGETYTLSVLLFRKGVFARLEGIGSGVPGGRLDLTIADRERFIPGLPGFGIHPNERAAGGALIVSDWFVAPVGPYRCKLGVIGDSLTAGPDGEPEEESYVHEVTRGLGQTHVLNTGSGGSTTTLDAARFAYEIAPFEPEVVWIEGGTNDIGMGVSAEAIFARLMEQAAAIDWGGHAVLSTVPPRTLPAERHYEQLLLLNELIRASGLPVVDRYRVVVDPGDPRHIAPVWSAPDGIHILRPGNALIAKEALAVIGKLIRPAADEGGSGHGAQ
ncbi:MAG: SGNH/GDSL hydrolase family protein [Paenibacillaceae bacterium]|nr:SGNH/GDSL hydrolase family protein [Paenibacillaceae bacterium]